MGGFGITITPIDPPAKQQSGFCSFMNSPSGQAVQGVIGVVTAEIPIIGILMGFSIGMACA